jgi:hypothetical protein
MESKMIKINEFQIQSVGDEVSDVILRKFQENIIAFVGTKKGSVLGFSKDKNKELFNFSNLSNYEIKFQEFLPKIPCSMTGDIRGNIQILDLANQKLISTYSRHSSEITGLKCFDENINNFISSSLDGSIKIWDLREKNEVMNFKNIEPISCSSLSPDDEIIVGGTIDGKIKLWNIRENKIIHEFNDSDSKKITHIRFHPSEIKMISTGKNKLINFYNLEEFVLEGKSNIYPKSITSLSYQEINNNVVILAGGPNFLRIHNDILKNTSSFKSIENNSKDCSDILVNDNDIYTISKIWNEIQLFKLSNTSQNSQIQTPKIVNQNPKKSIILSKEEEIKELKELQKSHIKIMQIQDHRVRNFGPLINVWFVQKNMDTTIKMLKAIDDLNFITDIINMILQNNLLDQMNIDLACILFLKADMLFGSTYKYFNLTAVTYFNKCLRRFTQDIISLKLVANNPKAVMNTEERIKKYDFFLSLIDNVIKKPSFEKIKNKFKEKDLGKLLENLYGDYMYIIDTIQKSNH